jgi:hypothetical protein
MEHLRRKTNRDHLVDIFVDLMRGTSSHNTTETEVN